MIKIIVIYIFFINLVSRIGSLIEELRLNVYEKVLREKESKLNLRTILENNVKSLEQKLKLTKEESNNYHINNIMTINSTSKIEYFNERIKREVYYMNKEIPLLKENISEV